MIRCQNEDVLYPHSHLTGPLDHVSMGAVHLVIVDDVLTLEHQYPVVTQDTTYLL